MNLWVELLVEVEEMRTYQKQFFKMKGNHPDKKLIMAKSKICEMKVDQLTSKLREIAKDKNIDLTKDELTEDD